jgi:hypothetical protein
VSPLVMNQNRRRCQQRGDCRGCGNDASLAFFKIAVDAFQRRGGSGLAIWVREAFRELPVDDQNVLIVIGLEARIEEMGITENRRS